MVRPRQFRSAGAEPSVPGSQPGSGDTRITWARRSGRPCRWPSGRAESSADHRRGAHAHYAARTVQRPGLSAGLARGPAGRRHNRVVGVRRHRCQPGGAAGDLGLRAQDRSWRATDTGRPPDVARAPRPRRTERAAEVDARHRLLHAATCGGGGPAVVRSEPRTSSSRLRRQPRSPQLEQTPTASRSTAAPTGANRAAQWVDGGTVPDAPRSSRASMLLLVGGPHHDRRTRRERTRGTRGLPHRAV